MYILFIRIDRLCPLDYMVEYLEVVECDHHPQQLTQGFSHPTSLARPLTTHNLRDIVHSLFLFPSVLVVGLGLSLQSINFFGLSISQSLCLDYEDGLNLYIVRQKESLIIPEVEIHPNVWYQTMKGIRGRGGNCGAPNDQGDCLPTR